MRFNRVKVGGKKPMAKANSENMKKLSNKSGVKQVYKAGKRNERKH